MNDIKYRYNEDMILNEITDYVNATCSQHYVTEGELQIIDVWKSLGNLDTTARDTAIKYLGRFGKKEGNNRKDLLKAIHYIMLMMYDTKDQ